MYAAPTLGQIGSAITVTNAGTSGNWSFGLDLDDIAGKPPIAQYVVVTGPPTMTIVSVTALHSLASSLSGYTTITPSTTNPPALSLGAYANVAKVGRWDWNTERFVMFEDDPASSQLLDSVDWSKPTIFLTHGWNATLTDANSPIKVFAQRFREAHDGDYLSYNILGVDWYNDGEPKGSLSSILDIGIAGIGRSADNGIKNGIVLSYKIDEAMKNWALANPQLTVAPLTLIGHSNGAGLMASLAISLSNLNDQTAEDNSIITKLVALDAPWETNAWPKVAEAAAYVPRVENYYIPIIRAAGGYEGNAGTGRAMLSERQKVVNFQLSESMTTLDLLGTPAATYLAHRQVFARYALTTNLFSKTNKWGFVGSDRFNVLSDGWIWKEQIEALPGHFRPFEHPLAYAYYAVDGIAETGKQIADGVVRLSRKTVDLAETGIDVLRDGAIKGFKSLTNVAQSEAQKVKNFVHFSAASPTLASMDVPIPGDADVLSFELSVLDSGNSDILLVGIDDDVLTGIDMDAVLRGGTATFTVPINNYAGMTRTLAFYMPSDEPSDAQFVVSNVRFLTLNKPPIPDLLTDKTVRVGQSLTFTATATDSEGDSVQFFLDDAAPADARIDSQTGVFTWTPPNDYPIGVYAISIWVADDGPGNPATEATVLITVNAIPIVTGPAATNSVQRPMFSWTAIPGATEYDIWVTKNPSTNPYHQATVTATSYTPPMDFGIGKFNLWVRAKNSRTVAPWTPKYTFVINTPVIPQAITRLQPTLRPTISWNALPGAVKYDVWINDVSRGIIQHIRNMDISGTSFTPSADLPLGLYRAWVRGIAAEGTAGSWSPGIEFVTMQAPTITQGQNSTFDRTPTFAWAALPGAAKYEVFIRNRNTGATTINQTNIAALSFTPSTPIPDGPYRWWAIGVSAEGVRSFWTAPLDIYIGGRTDLLAPLGSTTDTTPTFSWKPVDGAIRYELWVTHEGLNIRLIHETNLTTETYTPATALPTGAYRAWVRAVSSTGGIGVWSVQFNFVIAAVDSLAPDLPHQFGALPDRLLAEWSLVGAFPTRYVDQPENDRNSEFHKSKSIGTADDSSTPSDVVVIRPGSPLSPDPASLKTQEESAEFLLDSAMAHFAVVSFAE